MLRNKSKNRIMQELRIENDRLRRENINGMVTQLKYNELSLRQSLYLTFTVSRFVDFLSSDFEKDCAIKECKKEILDRINDYISIRKENRNGIIKLVATVSVLDLEQYRNNI